MGKLSAMGRIFYGISITAMGLLTIYYKSLPYMLLPQPELLFPGHLQFIYLSGVLLVLAGVCIILNKKIRPVSLWLGFVFLLIFCFDYIPYQLRVNPNFKQLIEWDNALKELAFAGGAFIIAGRFSEKNESGLFWRKLIYFGPVLFTIPIMGFGILHFLYAKDVSTLIPSWISAPVLWAYLAGVGLFGSGIAITFKIRPGLISFLLGTMIFIWFIILHIPRVVAAPASDLGGEVTSAFLALAYSGIAYVIAGTTREIIL
jgi:hypothetical protein